MGRNKLLFILTLCLIFGFTPAAAEDTDEASLNAYDLAGDAGIIVALGGLALNFMNTRNKFSRLELERLKIMQDEIDEERDKMRKRLEEQLAQVSGDNDKLQSSMLELQTKLGKLETENTLLKMQVAALRETVRK